VASPAMAQDSETAGGKFVVGAVVGVDQVEAELDGESGNDEGLLYGVTAGYDYETASGLVIGIEAEFTDSNISESQTDIDVLGDSATLRADRDLYVGGRLGFRPGKNGILYVKAGYTNAAIKAEYFDGASTTTSEKFDFDGFRLGAGGEITLDDRYAIRLEYRYSDYGSLDVLGFNTGVKVTRNQGVVTFLGKF